MDGRGTSIERRVALPWRTNKTLIGPVGRDMTKLTSWFGSRRCLMNQRPEGSSRSSPSSRATTSPEACQEAPREYSGFPLRFTSQEQPSAWHLPTVRHSILGTGFYTILKRCGKRAERDTARTVKLFKARHTRAYKSYLQNQDGTSEV